MIAAFAIVNVGLGFVLAIYLARRYRMLVDQPGEPWGGEVELDQLWGDGAATPETHEEFVQALAPSAANQAVVQALFAAPSERKPDRPAASGGSGQAGAASTAASIASQDRTGQGVEEVQSKIKYYTDELTQLEARLLPEEAQTGAGAK